MSRPVAVVTGASRGIGKRLCIDFAEHGYDVVCVARSRADQPAKLPGSVDATAEAVQAAGARALAVGLDVRDEDGIATLARSLEHEFGRCDVLVNNAALSPPRPALDDSTKRWRVAVDVNLNGPFYLIYHLRELLEAARGHVVNVSSMAALLPQFGRASYTATKRALEGMSEALAHDLEGRVGVNALRIDIPIWSEGFAETLPADSGFQFEDAVIVSDAVLWMVGQPISHTGKIHTLKTLREQGVVRPIRLATR